MTFSIAILGSTGSIGRSTLKALKKDKKYKIKLLTTNKNAKRIFRQAIQFKVKNIIITDEVKYNKYKSLFKKNNINLYLGLHNIKKILHKKISYSINAISGIEGLEPSLNIIPQTENFLIANKESIICGWRLLHDKLKKYNTKFIPIDSEHFSIWKLIQNEPKKEIKKVILTASGGPFLNKSLKNIRNISPKHALNHPTWKMGKKISIDSSNMMNKVLELIEAKKIFGLSNKDISILIHPTSYVHAIVIFKNNLIKILAHEANMIIPISNALNIKYRSHQNKTEFNLKKLNNMKFIKPNYIQFPTLSIINKIPKRDSYFETILISLNDSLVDKYLKGEINYISIQKNLLNLIESTYFKKYYKLKPKNIYDIKKMISITNNYLISNLKHYND
tara:strand:+ start:1173 stop:2345 length:1173 start_codon:yes stop_codon:yes gene_type:complete